MLKKNNPRKSYAISNRPPLENHQPASHSHYGNHQPPHIKASKVRLNYDAETVAILGKLYDNVEYLVDILENCPSEVKLTLAMVLGIHIDLSEYPEDDHPMMRFATPLLNDRNSELIVEALNCGESDTAVNMYNSCPPEQVLLALAIATLKKTSKEV